MMEFLASLTMWHWLVAAAILFVLELVAPGTFMLWLGLSAMIVGVISLVLSGIGRLDLWSWQYQLIAFAVLSLVWLPLWRRVARRVEKAGDQPFLNRRADAFIGREFTLEKPIVSGHGTVRIDDSVWRLSGPECPAGSRVKVVRADAALLVVEPV
jgi:membrane protein implicated in regulation of membrane protease activity